MKKAKAAVPKSPGGAVVSAPKEAANTGEGILAMMEEIWSQIPDEEMAKLPTDLAAQHDYYAYGLPKREE